MTSESSAFKHRVNADVVRRIGERIRGAHRRFDVEAFVGEVVPQLGALELKARVQRVAAGLHRHLGLPFPRAARVLVASCGPDDARNPVEGDAWMEYWPLVTYVGAYGLDHPTEALAALQELTKRASGEFDVRPYIVRYPELAFVRLHAWSGDPDWRVRRLASEGSRPRLPWGLRLQALVIDPSPLLPLLEAMRDDPHDNVRRSVANNLNDIGKDHPDLVVDLARRWMKRASPERAALLKDALRSLVKQGHRGALDVLGVARADAVALREFVVEPGTVAVGGTLVLHATLQSSSTKTVRVVVDYAVHHRRANGGTSPKVFKLTTRTLSPGETLELRKAHVFRPVTTRRYYPGQHSLELLVNGVSAATAAFTLTASEPLPPSRRSRRSGS